MTPIALCCTWQSQASTVRGRTDGRIDESYQVYNLPCFAVDNKLHLHLPKRAGTTTDSGNLVQTSLSYSWYSRADSNCVKFHDREHPELSADNELIFPLASWVWFSDLLSKSGLHKHNEWFGWLYFISLQKNSLRIWSVEKCPLLPDMIHGQTIAKDWEIVDFCSKIKSKQSGHKIYERAFDHECLSVNSMMKMTFILTCSSNEHKKHEKILSILLSICSLINSCDLSTENSTVSWE